MIPTRRMLVIVAAVLVVSCAERDAPTSPEIDPSGAMGKKPAPGGSGITIVDLGTLGGPFSMAHGINDQNQIVGGSTTSGGAGRAFLWDDGTLTNLGTLPGMTNSDAYDINEAGQVVGISSAGAGTARAFLWSAGTMQELPPPLGYCCSEAYAINDDGLVAGAVSLTFGSPHPAVWRDGVATDLKASGPGEGYAWDINASGRIVGTLNPGLSGGTQGSFTWTESDGLQLLDGTADGGEALAINDAGQIVGWNGSVAYYWDDGSRDYPGTLGGAYSAALGVNDATPVQVVGSSSVPRGSGHRAFIWTEPAGMRDLGLPKGRTGARAEDVNATGWVVGWTSSRSGADRATLWKVSVP